MSNELIIANNHLPITSGSLDQYIQQVNTIPMLTAEEEYDLVYRNMAKSKLHNA